MKDSMLCTCGIWRVRRLLSSKEVLFLRVAKALFQPPHGLFFIKFSSDCMYSSAVENGTDDRGRKDSGVMHNLFRVSAALLFAIGISQGTSTAQPVGRTDCGAQAISDLKRLAPRGYAIYQAMTNKSQFLHWLTCDDVLLGLATGVHESVHLLTEERDAFPLLDGGEIRRPHQVSQFFAPGKIANKFDRNDPYVQSYLLPGGASSKDDFLYLLDELNAYSHDLHSAVKLVSLQRRDRHVDHRDGLAALMMFVMGYVDTAQRTSPATWQGLQRPETRRVVQTLWAQAETTLASSCGIPGFGMKDQRYIAAMCEQKNSSALATLLGRAPSCPSECLSPATTSSTTR